MSAAKKDEKALHQKAKAFLVAYKELKLSEELEKAGPAVELLPGSTPITLAAKVVQTMTKLKARRVLASQSEALLQTRMKGKKFKAIDAKLYKWRKDLMISFGDKAHEIWNIGSVPKASVHQHAWAFLKAPLLRLCGADESSATHIATGAYQRLRNKFKRDTKAAERKAATEKTAKTDAGAKTDAAAKTEAGIKNSVSLSTAPPAPTMDFQKQLNMMMRQIANIQQHIMATSPPQHTTPATTTKSTTTPPPPNTKPAPAPTSRNILMERKPTTKTDEVLADDLFGDISEENEEEEGEEIAKAGSYGDDNDDNDDDGDDGSDMKKVTTIYFSCTNHLHHHRSQFIH